MIKGDSNFHYVATVYSHQVNGLLCIDAEKVKIILSSILPRETVSHGDMFVVMLPISMNSNFPHRSVGQLNDQVMGLPCRTCQVCLYFSILLNHLKVKCSSSLAAIPMVNVSCILALTFWSIV